MAFLAWFPPGSPSQGGPCRLRRFLCHQCLLCLRNSRHPLGRAARTAAPSSPGLDARGGPFPALLPHLHVPPDSLVLGRRGTVQAGSLLLSLAAVEHSVSTSLTFCSWPWTVSSQARSLYKPVCGARIWHNSPYDISVYSEIKEPRRFLSGVCQVASSHQGQQTRKPSFRPKPFSVPHLTFFSRCQGLRSLSFLSISFLPFGDLTVVSSSSCPVESARHLPNNTHPPLPTISP